MKCYKRLVYKQFVQISRLCGPQFLSNLAKRFTQLCRALYGDAFRRVLHVAQHEFPISQTLAFLNFLTNILTYRNGTMFCSSPKATCSEYFTFYLFEENS